MLNNNRDTKDSQPWYREPWPWIIMAFPFTSMVLGAMMLTLALNTNNSLVVDDYYKQGKGINRRIARDRRALELGVVATVSRTDSGIGLTISTLTSDDPEILSTVYAAEFVLRWTHITQSERDGEAILRPIGQGRYASVGTRPLPTDGHFRLHLQPIGNEWRLVSPPVSLESSKKINIEPSKFAVPGAVS